MTSPDLTRLLGAVLIALNLHPALAVTAVPSSESSQDLGKPDAVSREMEDWLAEAVPARLKGFDKLQGLLAALERDPDGPRLNYYEGTTATAKEAFRHGRVNCLSYSHLVVGLARSIGVEAFYMDVQDREAYSKEGDLIIVSGHITVGFDQGPERRILEFQIGPNVDYKKAVRISDERAHAYFRTNRGAEALRAGQVSQAMAWLTQATQTYPELPDAWVNLGVALRRDGKWQEAEEAYRHAVTLNEEFFPAYQNLASLYYRKGDPDGARHLLELLEQHRARNPFVYLALGDLSSERGELEDAERFYKKGRRLGRREPEILAALGEVAMELGDHETARKWLAKATKQDSENPRVVRLGTELLAAETKSGG